MLFKYLPQWTLIEVESALEWFVSNIPKDLIGTIMSIEWFKRMTEDWGVKCWYRAGLMQHTQINTFYTFISLLIANGFCLDLKYDIQKWIGFLFSILVIGDFGFKDDAEFYAFCAQQLDGLNHKWTHVAKWTHVITNVFDVVYVYLMKNVERWNEDIDHLMKPEVFINNFDGPHDLAENFARVVFNILGLNWEEFE